MDDNKMLIGPISYANVGPVCDWVEAKRGARPAPRTIENAMRRGQLSFIQMGQKRYVTGELIEAWLDSCETTANTVAAYRMRKRVCGAGPESVGP